MIVIRFKVQCQPDKVEELKAAFAAVIAPSRAIPGVLNFDIARDLSNPNSFIATEVFENAGARERQEALPEVGAVMSILETALSAPPEATAFHVASSEAAL